MDFCYKSALSSRGLFRVLAGFRQDGGDGEKFLSTSCRGIYYRISSNDTQVTSCKVAFNKTRLSGHFQGKFITV